MNNINVAPYTRPVRTVQWEGQKLKLFLYPIAIKTNDVNIPEKVPNRTEIDTDNILKVLFYVIFIIPVLKL